MSMLKACALAAMITTTLLINACSKANSNTPITPSVAGIPDGAIIIGFEPAYFAWTKWKLNGACFMSRSLLTSKALITNFPCPESFDSSRIVSNGKIVTIKQ